MSNIQPLTEQQLDEIDAAIAAYQQHAPTGFACCSAHPAADAGAALVAEVRRLRAELAELQSTAAYARYALAALCYDLEDPGINALGALYLISRATVGVEAPRDDAALALAKHAAEVLERTADMADPEPPEASFFGDYGPQVADWLRRRADYAVRDASATPAA